MSRDPNEFLEGGTKVPSAKFKTIGDHVVGVITETDVMQCRSFETNEPEWWDEAKTQPKEQLVVTLQTELRDPSITDDDGKRRIYATKPSSILTAIHAVTLAKGHRLEIGGRLAVKFVGEKPHENPRLNAIKQYEAAYQPPAAAAVDSLLGGAGTPAPNGQAAPEPVPVGATAGGVSAEDLL